MIDSPRRVAPAVDAINTFAVPQVISRHFDFVARPYLVPSESMEPTLHGCKGCAGEQVMGKAVAPIGDPSTSLVIGPY